MKKFLLFTLLAAAAIPAMAELAGDGYYRVQNAVTKRYAYLLDDKGSFNVNTTSADVNALQLYTGFLKASSDPATVFWVSKAPTGGLDHDVAAQGTSLHTFLDTYLKILDGKEYDGQKSYYAYASKSGFTKYLGDLRDYESEEGRPSVDAQGDNRLWYIIPLNSSDNEGYFGIAPTVTADGKYFHPFYADFPFAASSQGVKFYTIVKVDPGHRVVVKREITGVVPASVPVIVECANPLSSDNRLEIGQSGAPANVSGNMLKGVYFNNDRFRHENQKPFDRATMRVLASDGDRLVFTTASHDFVPRSEAYLELSPEDAGVDTYTVVSEAEYEVISGVDGIIEENATVDVYGIDGTLVKSGISKDEVPSLGKGIFILRSGDAVEKVVLH